MGNKQKKQCTYDLVLRIALIGPTKSGKSSLFSNFVGEDFREDYIETIGVDYWPKTLLFGTRKIKLQIWDTAGHERFRRVTTGYYRGAEGIIMVYSIADRSQFEALRGEYLSNVRIHAR